MYLLSYKYQFVHCFGDGEYQTIYELTVLKKYLFGLIKKTKKIEYKVSMFHNIEEHEEHWDQLIKKGLKTDPK